MEPKTDVWPGPSECWNKELENPQKPQLPNQPPFLCTIYVLYVALCFCFISLIFPIDGSVGWFVNTQNFELVILAISLVTGQNNLSKPCVFLTVNSQKTESQRPCLG